MQSFKRYMTVVATVTGLMPIFSTSLFSLDTSQKMLWEEKKEQLNRASVDFIQVANALEPYKSFLEEGTYKNQNWSELPQLPLSRYYTLKLAFKMFVQAKGKTVVELGSSRRPPHERTNPTNWDPNDPKTWHWEEGCFTRLAAECLQHLNPTIYSVDSNLRVLEECQKFVESHSHMIQFYKSSSVEFLNSLPPRSIDLLYLDTGEIWPLEPSARLQLEEAKAIVYGDLMSDTGIILIDDVKNQTPRKYGQKDALGKSKYAIPFLLENGFEYVGNEYQVILKRKK